MEVGEDGRHFENMTTKFQTDDIVKMKSCKKVESKDDLWEITSLNGFACEIVNLADHLRAEEQGLKIKAHAFDTSLVRKVL
jgi:hypothetical protein